MTDQYLITLITNLDRRVKELEDLLNSFMKAQITINNKQHDINYGQIEASKFIFKEIKRLDIKELDDGK